jgi:hypothetical protein
MEGRGVWMDIDYYIIFIFIFLLVQYLASLHQSQIYKLHLIIRLIQKIGFEEQVKLW